MDQIARHEKYGDGEQLTSILEDSNLRGSNN